MIIILDLKYRAILNRNYFKNCCRKKIIVFVFCVIFVSCPKNFKISSDLTKSCNYVNKDYDYDYLSIKIFYLITFRNRVIFTGCVIYKNNI